MIEDERCRWMGCRSVATVLIDVPGEGDDAGSHHDRPVSPGLTWEWRWGVFCDEHADSFVDLLDAG